MITKITSARIQNFQVYYFCHHAKNCTSAGILPKNGIVRKILILVKEWVIPLAVNLELSFAVVIRAEVSVDSNHVTEVQKFSSFGEILDWHKVIVKS